jgi:hypothetical protein
MDYKNTIGQICKILCMPFMFLESIITYLAILSIALVHDPYLETQNQATIKDFKI